MIEFNVPVIIQEGLDYMSKSIIENHKMCGDGYYTKQTHKLVEQKFNVQKVLLTTSCTHALEMAAMLINIQPGDEVIAPSFTFVSTVNSFVLRGAKIVFVDIRQDTMNIDEKLIEAAITNRTKAIVPVHYAGVSCEMDEINRIAKKYNLYVIEDAAQGIMSTYNGKALGTISDLGCFSFNETKNYTMGEGGALLINNSKYNETAEIMREKGTDRSRFLRGQIDKYSWVEVGSSYLPSELNVAYLFAQLEKADLINQRRLEIWNKYFNLFSNSGLIKYIDLPFIPGNCTHNAHMFYIKCRDIEERTQLMSYLKERNIQTVFHYIPLHSAPAGLKYSRFHGEDKYTTSESERLLRLPLHFHLSDNDIESIVEAIKGFYGTY